jgi:hypothetical protein
MGNTKDGTRTRIKAIIQISQIRETMIINTKDEKK